MATPWLHPTSQFYYFRKAVPERLQPLVGKALIKISLKTRNATEAKTRFVEVAAAVAEDWARLEAERAALPPDQPPIRLRQEDVAALAGELYHGLIKQHGSDPGRPIIWMDKLKQLQPALPKSQRLPGVTVYFDGPFSLAHHASRLMKSDVSALLASKSLHVDAESRGRLNAAAASAIAQAYKELAKRAANDYTPDPVASSFPVYAPPSAASSLKWHEAFEKYKEAAKPAASSVKRQRGVLEAFFKFIGHDDLAAVTRDDAERWMEHRLTKVAASTVRDADVAHPKTLCIFAKRKKLIAHNPFEDIMVYVPDKPVLRDREFDQDEAERILRATLLPRTKNLSDEGLAARRWMPWIMCYTGARVNEISQARAADIEHRRSRSGERIWCIRLTPEAGTIKNGKARWVALHPHLIEQGFLRYVETRAGRHLFYDPERRRDGSDANPQYKNVGEALARWVRNTVGIKDTGVDPNHGWRHLFRSSLLAAGIQEQIIDRIDGHASKTVGQSYGTAWPEVMLAAISTIPAYRVEGLE